MISHVSISLCDALNPGFGYQIRVEGGNGRALLFTSRDPVTGADLLTLSDALRVAGMYADPEQRTRAVEAERDAARA